MKVLVIGSGLAGFSAALSAYLKGDEVTLVSKSSLDVSNSWKAQGGIVYGSKGNDTRLLVEDILKASANVSSRETASFIAEKAKEAIDKLLVNTLRVPFNREDGELALTREGGHSEKRIIYHYDHTGRSIIEAFITYMREETNVVILEGAFLAKLLYEEQSSSKVVSGATFIKDGSLFSLHAQRVILATGGIGECYLRSSNSAVATGDGISLCHQLGLPILNMEYTQFHPTYFYDADGHGFLVSEALRGEGAVVVNTQGEDILKSIHPLGSLAPRDVVSQNMYQYMVDHQLSHLYLDTSKVKHSLQERFPMIFELALEKGVDIGRQPIPITPIYHFCCGGVKTDLHGRTDAGNLYVVGESACSGLHGANRLASTSLLECLVMGREAALDDRVVDTTSRTTTTPHPKKAEQSLLKNPPIEMFDQMRSEIKALMWNNVGIVREPQKVEDAKHRLEDLKITIDRFLEEGVHPSLLELSNICRVSTLVATAALNNHHSIGCHKWKNDSPKYES